MPPAAIAAALVLCAIGCVWAVWRWWPAARTAQAPPVEVESSASRAIETSGDVSPKVFVVHVTGAVRRPGVYSLVAGARVIDAVKKAGGLLGDAAEGAVNLARPVADGEQILVPDKDDPVAAAVRSAVGAAGGGSAGGSASGPIDINSADAASLDTLPGVGPSTAAKIIADRDTNGPFLNVDDLGRVSGIGPKKLEQLRELVCAR